MGPIGAHMGPYVPIWARMGPPGPTHHPKPFQKLHQNAGPGSGLGPFRVGARSGLGPIWALMGPYMGPYGPLWAHIWAHIWAHVGPYGSSWTGLGKSVNFPSTFRTTIWTNFACFGSKTEFLMKLLDDSASFLLEKLKNHIILTKNFNI